MGSFERYSRSPSLRRDHIPWGQRILIKDMASIRRKSSVNMEGVEGGGGVGLYLEAGKAGAVLSDRGHANVGDAPTSPIYTNAGVIGSSRSMGMDLRRTKV